MTNHSKAAGHQGNSPFNTSSLPKNKEELLKTTTMQCFINNLMLFVAR